MAKFAVDRIEGTRVVLEDEQGNRFPVPGSWIPASTRDGDVLSVTEERPDENSAAITFRVDPAARDERLRSAQQLRDSLPRGPKGDIAL